MKRQLMTMILAAVTVATSATLPARADNNLYCVIDLFGGADAASYPVTYLDVPPDGGFNTDEYKTTKLVLRRVEPGTVMMQADAMSSVLTETKITRPFYIGVFQVTQKQYELITGESPATYKGDMRPVEQVSYDDIRGSSAGAEWPASPDVDASSVLGKLRAKTGLDALDLPTEAQWEYACRAGTTSGYNNGESTLQAPKVLGRFSENKGDGHGGYEQHTTVGSYLPNSWGLYDMHGNVCEWCLDWYASSLAGGNDPSGATSGSSRIIRGGCWSDGGMFGQSSTRFSSSPSTRDFKKGFRLCYTLPPDNTWQSGDCTVTFDEETSTLTVSGAGAMADYYDMEMPPWYGKAENDIKKVVIEDGVTRIGDSAFWYCMNVESVSIPSSVTSIGEAAFGNWYALADVQLHDGLDTIGCGAFYGNYMTSFTIPATVTAIGSRAFFKTDISDVYCWPDASDLWWGPDASADFKSDGSTKIHVKASQLAAYQAKFPHVNVTFVGDLDMTPEIAATIDAIDAIGEVTYTGECKAKIDAAREAYDALTDEQKALVTNYATLTAAEAAYAAFDQGGQPDDGGETPFTVTQPWTANAKAVLNGAMYDAAGNVAGVAQLKVSKPKTDKKKGVKTVKVSGYLLPNSGKKVTLKSTTAVVSASAPTEVPVPAKQLGTFRVKIGDDGFLGTAGAYTAHTAAVGGKWTRGGAKVYAVATSATLPDGTLEDLLPDGEPVIAKGGKWSFAKASSVKYAKDAKTKALTLTVNDRNGTAGNKSAMKLTYTPKTGVFKGSFKVYAIQGGKLKKYTVKVNGVVVEGEGTGVGKLAKPSVTWSVSVR